MCCFHLLVKACPPKDLVANRAPAREAETTLRGFVWERTFLKTAKDSRAQSSFLDKKNFAIFQNGRNPLSCLDLLKSLWDGQALLLLFLIEKLLLPLWMHGPRFEICTFLRNHNEVVQGFSPTAESFGVSAKLGPGALWGRHPARSREVPRSK